MTGLINDGNFFRWDVIKFDDIPLCILTNGHDVAGMAAGIAEFQGIDLPVKKREMLREALEDQVVNGNDRPYSGILHAEGNLVAQPVEQLNFVFSQVPFDTETSPVGARASLGKLNVEQGAVQEEVSFIVSRDLRAIEEVGIVGVVLRQVGQQSAAVIAQAGEVIKKSFGVVTDA